jgi:adenylate kinase
VRIVLLGPPGAGKGTQAKRLSERFGITHIASGDLFRDNLTRRTELGLLAKTYMDRGELVPDDLTVVMIVDGLQRTPGGFILDGFPRTVPQAKALEGELESSGTPLDAVLAFVIDEELAVRRIAGRRTCSLCQRAYHVDSNPPRVPGVCDVCGGALVQRDDDNENTVRRRLEVYRESTAPLLKFYSDRGLLREIDADGTEDDVTERAIAALGDVAVAG